MSKQQSPGIQRRLKNCIKNNPLGKWIVGKRKEKRDKERALRRAPYLPELSELLGKNTSIISSNCFSGRVMQDLGMEYNSPTLGLYFWAEDYIEFLSNLEYYLTEAKIEFVEHSKYELGDERRANWEHWYPIGLLGGKVEIQFLHYHTEEEAAEKWYRRASRVNYEKLIIIGMEQNYCTEDVIRRFGKLPYERKYFFSSKNLPDVKSNVYLEQFVPKGEVGDAYQYGDVYYKHLIEQLKK